MALFLILLMAVPVITVGASGPEKSAGTAARSITDTSADLIVPAGETYELAGCHTYTSSIQINGTLKITPYDGSDDETGMIWLSAPWITIGPSGAILADGRGFGGGGGGSDQWGNGGGRAGTGGNGGDADSVSWGYAGGGGGGSNGGYGGGGGWYGGYSGQDGTDTKGGDGGDNMWGDGWAGKGGSGFGGGGGGGADDEAYYGYAAGGGGGGSGGKDANGPDGGNGGGTAAGTGGSDSAPAIAGTDGGYITKGINGDTSTDLSVRKGSGGGGAGSTSYDYIGGGGGGGAGGGSVELITDGDISISGKVTTAGAGGGKGGMDYYGGGGNGGGGGGGGIAIKAQKASISGTLDARGRKGDSLDSINGGTVKIIYMTNAFGSANIQAGRKYTNGRPAAPVLLTPGQDQSGVPKTQFTWDNAADPDRDTVTYHLQVSVSPTFATTVIDKEGIADTQYTSTEDLSLSGSTLYWRVRAKDSWGYGLWSEGWRFLIDVTPPASLIQPLPACLNTTAIKLVWNGTDDMSGIATFTIWVAEGTTDLEYVPWQENTVNRSGTYRGEDGKKYSFYSTAIDKGNNHEAPHAKADTCTTIDVSPPVTKMTPLAAWQPSLTFKVAWSAKDATSGVQFYNVFVSDDTGPFEIWQEQTTDTSAEFEGLEGHEYAFYATAVDNVWNAEDTPDPETAVKTRIDLTAPVTILRLGDPNFGQDPVFTTAATQFTLDPSDDFSGLNSTMYAIDSRDAKTYNAPVKELVTGSHNLTYWSTDKAGNKETAGKFWFFVDGDNPVTALKVIGPNVTGDNGKNYISANTTFVLTATDGGCGVSYMEYNMDNRGYLHYVAPIKAPAAGPHTITYRSADNLGNVEAERSYKFAVDTLAPTSKATASDTKSRETITVMLNATDADSGVAAIYFRVVRERKTPGDFIQGTEALVEANEDHSLDGNYTVQFYSVDKLNNTEQVRELKVKIDTSVVLVTLFTGEPSVNVNHYLLEGKTDAGSTVTLNNEPVVVTAGGAFSQDVELKPGKNKFVITTTDAVGNTATKTVYITYNQPATESGLLMPVLALVIILVVVAVVVVMLMRRKKAPPQQAPPQAPAYGMQPAAYQPMAPMPPQAPPAYPPPSSPGPPMKP